MKKYCFLFILIYSFALGNAQYTWVNKSQFADSGFYGGAGFVINGMGYIIGGSAASSSGSNHTWQYNPQTDTWTQKANYPHTTGAGAFFSINGTGYQVGGYNSSTGLYSSDNNAYDPVADTWISKSAYPEAGVGGGFYFVINGIAYVGGGVRNANEHGVVSGYSYNPETDSWSSMADYPGTPAIGLCTFAIDSFGYAGMGGDGSGNFFNEMYKYSPATNSWTQIASFPAKSRYNGTSDFVVADKGYVGAGATSLNGSSSSFYALSDYYMYDPVTNSWSPAPGLQGPPRHAPTALSFGDSAYLVAGYNQDGNVVYDYVDEFKPAATAVCTRYDTIHISVTDTLIISVSVGITPNNSINTIDVYPNPAHNQLYINTGNYAVMAGYSLKITNTLGQIIYINAVNQQLLAINTSSWTAGVYFLQIIDPNSTVVTTKEIVVQ